MEHSDLDWANLAVKINDRMAELGLSQAGLARLAHVSDATISSLCLGKPKAYRRLTLRMVENSLGWMGGSVDEVLEGGEPKTLLSEYRKLQKSTAANPYADSIVDGEDGPSPYTTLEWMRQELVGRGEIEETETDVEQRSFSAPPNTVNELRKVVSNLEDRIAILERLMREVTQGSNQDID